MNMLEKRLYQVLNDIIELLGTGKAECYANVDLIKFEPHTVDKLNRLLAQRNLLVEMLQENKEIEDNV